MAWIHIDVQPQAFTLNEQRVKDMLDAGKNMFQIAAKMFMGIDCARDMIYSIRKKEAIILAKLSNQEKGEIYRSYKNGTRARMLERYGAQTARLLDNRPCVFDDFGEMVEIAGTWMNEEYDPEEMNAECLK